MDRATLLQRLKAQTPPDYLLIAADYGELKSEEQNPSIRHHLALLEQSYRALAESMELLIPPTASSRSPTRSSQTQ